MSRFKKQLLIGLIESAQEDAEQCFYTENVLPVYLINVEFGTAGE